ncbi:hypothetical protein GCM10009608_50530 [Pseudonocardia alaniniphila]
MLDRIAGRPLDRQLEPASGLEITQVGVYPPAFGAPRHTAADSRAGSVEKRSGGVMTRRVITDYSERYIQVEGEVSV